LERTLKALHIPQDEWRPHLDRTDFGDIDKHCRLVLSWPGKYAMQSERSGHRMLAKVIRELDIAPLPCEQLVIEYQVRACI
jgi:hypothetical protein